MWVWLTVLYVVPLLMPELLSTDGQKIKKGLTDLQKHLMLYMHRLTIEMSQVTTFNLGYPRGRDGLPPCSLFIVYCLFYPVP